MISRQPIAVVIIISYNMKIWMKLSRLKNDRTPIGTRVYPNCATHRFTRWSLEGPTCCQPHGASIQNAAIAASNLLFHRNWTFSFEVDRAICNKDNLFAFGRKVWITFIIIKGMLIIIKRCSSYRRSNYPASLAPVVRRTCITTTTFCYTLARSLCLRLSTKHQITSIEDLQLHQHYYYWRHVMKAYAFALPSGA